jgi:hypothetical protein
MEKPEIVQTILLNKFVLTLLVIMLMLALSSGIGIAEMSQPPQLPF